MAQDRNVGCDGAVSLKAGRSGPCTELAKTIAGLLEGPAVARDHWGIAVTAMDGAPIYSLNEGQLFQPASNAKLFTTAAAMALLGPETTFETKIVARGMMDGTIALKGDLVLVGGGDANLSGQGDSLCCSCFETEGCAGCSTFAGGESAAVSGGDGGPSGGYGTEGNKW